MTQHPHPPPRQQWPVLYLGERGTGGSGLSWRTTALWAEALPRTQSFPTLECSNFSHIKDWLVVSSSPRWRCALTLGVTTEPRIGTAAFWWNRGTEIPQIRWGRGCSLWHADKSGSGGGALWGWAIQYRFGPDTTSLQLQETSAFRHSQMSHAWAKRPPSLIQHWPLYGETSQETSLLVKPAHGAHFWTHKHRNDSYS